MISKVRDRVLGLSVLVKNEIRKRQIENLSEQDIGKTLVKEWSKDVCVIECCSIDGHVNAYCNLAGNPYFLKMF